MVSKQILAIFRNPCHFSKQPIQFSFFTQQERGNCLFWLLTWTPTPPPQLPAGWENFWAANFPPARADRAFGVACSRSSRTFWSFFFAGGRERRGGLCLWWRACIYFGVVLFSCFLTPRKMHLSFFCVCFPNMTRMRQERHTRSRVCVEEASAEICFPLCWCADMSAHVSVFPREIEGRLGDTERKNNFRFISADMKNVFVNRRNVSFGFPEVLN